MANGGHGRTITEATRGTSSGNAEADGGTVLGAQQEAVRQLSKYAA
jgi:hypothetical protein